jgi:hypothetical protein
MDPKMETAGFSEILVTIYKTTRLNVLEQSDPLKVKAEYFVRI